MSYHVLARKWRPQSFHEMVGQEHVLKALINALDNDRLHHAYLFTGTRGVGKTTLARILAKCLNCEQGVSSQPCGKCSACIEIKEGRFVDLLEVDAASRTKVEDTRELLDNVQYAPTRGRYKIYLIDEVHMLSNHSFNALLKTLEEPPEHVKFLLATTDPQKLPITVLSRCLQFNLKNMSPERIVAHLKHILDEESVPFEETALWLLARAADGSMRDALSLSDQAIAFGSGELAEEDVSAMLGTIDHRFIESLLSALAAAEPSVILDTIAQFAEQAPDFDAALAAMLSLLHRVSIAQLTPEAVDNSLGDRSLVLRFATDISPEDIQLFYQIALLGRRDLNLASDPRSGFEMTLMRMLAFKPTLPGGRSQQGPASNATENKKSDSRHHRAPGSQPTALFSVPRDTGREPEAKVSAVSPTLTDQSGDVALRQKEPEAVKQTAMSSETSARNTSAVTEAHLQSEKDLPKAHQLDALTPETWLGIAKTLDCRGLVQNTVFNSIPESVHDNKLVFCLDERKASLFDVSHEKNLAQLLSQYFGVELSVSIVVKALPQGIETPAAYQARMKQEQQQRALETLQNDPVVQTLERSFDAQLDPLSIQFVNNRMN